MTGQFQEMPGLGSGLHPPRDLLFVQSSTEIGGAETVLVNLFEASAELRERSVIATLGFGRGDLANRLRQVGAVVREFQAARLRRPWALPRTITELSRLAEEVGTHTVVGNGCHPQIFASRVARKRRAQSVMFVHEILRTPLLRNSILEIVALTGACDLMIASSGASADTLHALKPRMPCRVVYPGTPARTVSLEQTLNARRELGAIPGQVVFGMFGRFQRRKGQDIFLRAAAAVAPELPSARFIVVGGAVAGVEPEYTRELSALALDRRLAGRVTFMGFRSDATTLMAGCDVVCHSCRLPESFGMVVVEAMMQARPVIATRGGGPSEIIQDGLSGRLVEAGSVEAMARAMLELGRAEAMRRSLGTAAQERVERNFTSARMAEALLACLS